MKYLPNAVTAVRIIGAPILLPVRPLSVAFFAVYLLCGASDMADGYLARKFRTESVFGARLDSAADLLFTVCVIIRNVPEVSPGTGIYVFAAVIVLLRFGAAITARIRFGVFGWMHTYGNKATGLILFLYPLSLAVSRSSAVLIMMCSVAALSAAEELLIGLTAREWNPDRKSLFTGWHGRAL